MVQKNTIHNQVYIDQGLGDPIVLLHGLFANVNNWKAVVDHFNKDHRVIIPRLPIFDLPHDQVNMEELCVVLDEFLDWHQLSDVTLVGNSSAGHLALLYALRKPNHVKQLVLTGCSGLFDKRPDEAEELINNSFVNERTMLRPASHKKASELSIRSNYYFKHDDVFSSLHKIHQPVLLIWGLQDKVTPPEIALHFHDLLPNSELKFIDQCGHVPMTEQPELFNEHLEEFLKANA